MSRITLQNMKFHAFHGCLDFEKREGNTFLVTISMNLDTSIAEETDNLEDTLNYQEVYDVVKKEMENPSELIEYVARRIYNALKNTFPKISTLKVELSKMNPPLGGDVESVKIEISD